MSATLRALTVAALLHAGLAAPASGQHVHDPAPAAQQPGDSGHGQPEAPESPTASEQDHQAHQAGDEQAPGAAIPPLTDEDRAAAFPDLDGQHTVHDDTVHYFVLFDQLEWQSIEGGGFSLDNKSWVGLDRDRLWFRGEAGSEEGRVEEAEIQLLYGRQFSRWWDVVAGIRQDFRPGPARTWAAIGVQGLAPYWFEVEATAYVGGSGRTHFRFETEYELLLTNRLVLQPLVEVDIHGKSDPERGIGAGISETEAGFRVRYEVRREIAPYLGVTWRHKHGETAESARAAGEGTGGARMVAGMRVWF